ncbi:hypothetical protein [Schlesneria sp. DSM 10557]|uniref:hypothetical protein n=1 Tax=Schlesneria sp. DSM 10557 TaxID=3044399 RepID=UPI0035A0609C
MTDAKRSLYIAPLLFSVALAGLAEGDDGITVVIEAGEAAAAEAEESPLIEKLAAPLQLLFGGNVGNVIAPVLELAPGVDGAQNEAMLQQYQAQFRPYVLEELAFVRLVCSQLTVEQRKKIKSASDEALKSAAKQLAQANSGRNGPFARPVDPRTIIVEGIQKALRENLPTDLLERYTRESGDRKTVRQQAAILSTISRLDGALYLTSEQRETLAGNFRSHWQESWENWLMISMYGPEYLPNVPAEVINPSLSDEQKAVYNTVQKIDVGMWWGWQQPPDDPWWGEPQGGDANGAVNVIINQLPMIIQGNAVDVIAVEVEMNEVVAPANADGEEVKEGDSDQPR